jgi:hypothetical protein
MTHKDIYNKFISKVNSKYQDLINEIESIANKRKEDCNNAYHLSCVVRENISDNYINFITKHTMSYGLDSLIGTEFYHNSGIIPTKLAYEIISYPMKYSESLFE